MCSKQAARRELCQHCDGVRAGAELSDRTCTTCAALAAQPACTIKTQLSNLHRLRWDFPCRVGYEAKALLDRNAGHRPTQHGQHATPMLRSTAPDQLGQRQVPGKYPMQFQNQIYNTVRHFAAHEKIAVSLTDKPRSHWRCIAQCEISTHIRLLFQSCSFDQGRM